MLVEGHQTNNIMKFIVTYSLKINVNVLLTSADSKGYVQQCYLIQTLHLSRTARNPTVWTLRNVSTRISLSIPYRLIRTGTFRLLWIFCIRNHYSIHLSPWDGMSGSGSVCVDFAGGSGSIHNEEAIMLVFSRNGSFVNKNTSMPAKNKIKLVWCARWSGSALLTNGHFLPIPIAW